MPTMCISSFCFIDTATPDIYTYCHTLSLHDALPIYMSAMYRAAVPVAMTPYITEERQLNVAQMDVFSRLIMDRVIFLGEPVDDRVANIIQAQLLFLQDRKSTRLNSSH